MSGALSSAWEDWSGRRGQGLFSSSQGKVAPDVASDGMLPFEYFYKKQERSEETLISLDWADNNEKWNSQKVRPGDEVLKGSTVLSSDQAHLPFQSLKDGSGYKNDELHLNKESEVPRSSAAGHLIL